MPEKQQENTEIKFQKPEQEITKQNLNSILIEMKKWDLSKEKIEHIVNYVLKLAQIESKYNEQKEQLKIDVRFFIENSIKNTLDSNIKKYNVSEFNVDWQEWIDETEEENYSKAIWESIWQIIILWWLDKFTEINYESTEKPWFSIDKYIANSLNLSKFIPWGKQGKHFMESIIQKYWMISESDLKKMQERPFDITSKESRWDLAILLFKEFWDGTEDVLSFLWNIPSGLVLLPRYTSYRIDSNSENPQIKVEGKIKLNELIDQNPSLWILEILWEKWIDMLKHLWVILTSWKQWDIATAMVTIAWLLAWWAWVAKFWIAWARKSAVISARQAWREARMVWETTSRTSRNNLKAWAQKAWEIENVANKVDDIVWGAGIGHITGAFLKDKVAHDMTQKEKEELQTALEENLELREKVKTELKKKNALEINKFIDEIVEKVDIKSVPEKELIRERAKELMQEIALDSNFSPDVYKILIDIRNDIFANLSSWMGIRSLTHILESALKSSKIPKNEKVERFLQSSFWNISESEFYTTVTIFHDLVKNTLPTSVVQYIWKDTLEKLSIVKWWQLSSHQLESANFLRSFMDKKDSKIYKWLEEFLEKKGIAKEKVPAYIEALAKTIEWHGWNTEFIQHDSSKSIVNILDNVDGVSKENKIDELIDDIINAWLINEDSTKKLLMQIKEMQGQEGLSQKSDLLKKVLVQEFIKNNVWKNIEIKDINLDELYLMNSNLTNSQKIDDIFDYISNNWNIDIDSLVQQKYNILKDNRALLNKYLHTVDSPIIEEEAARFAFNLNDISWYANPSTEGFRKLIMFNNIDSLISSPLNSSLALLAELKFAIWNETNIIFRQKLEKMYDVWLTNIQILKENYSKKLAQKLPENTPEFILELWWNTFWEAYKRAIDLIQSKTISPGSDKFNNILQYYRTEFQAMCENSETKDLFS